MARDAVQSERAAAFYSENVTRLTPIGIQRGHAEIAKVLEDVFKNGNLREFIATVEQAHQNGNEAWAFGSTTLTISVPNNEALHAKLLWVDVFELQSGVWKSRIDAYNDQPPPKPAQ